MDNVLDKITSQCAKHFGLDERDLYSSTRNEDVVIARHLLWYILHVHYNISTGLLSKEFFRSRRQIFNGICKIKNGIKRQKFYNELYKGFIEVIKKEENKCCTKE